jgi:hypothetical protein
MLTTKDDAIGFTYGDEVLAECRCTVVLHRDSTMTLGELDRFLNVLRERYVIPASFLWRATYSRNELRISNSFRRYVRKPNLLDTLDRAMTLMELHPDVKQVTLLVGVAQSR